MPPNSVQPTLQAPNPELHRAVSFIKSVFRIVAGVTLACGNLVMAGALIVIAEALGIVEELV